MSLGPAHFKPHSLFGFCFLCTSHLRLCCSCSPPITLICLLCTHPPPLNLLPHPQGGFLAPETHPPTPLPSPRSLESSLKCHGDLKKKAKASLSRSHCLRNAGRVMCCHVFSVSRSTENVRAGARPALLQPPLANSAPSL